MDSARRPWLAATVCVHRPAYSISASGGDQSRPYIPDGGHLLPLLSAAGEKNPVGLAVVWPSPAAFLTPRVDKEPNHDGAGRASPSRPESNRAALNLKAAGLYDPCALNRPQESRRVSTRHAESVSRYGSRMLPGMAIRHAKMRALRKHTGCGNDGAVESVENRANEPRRRVFFGNPTCAKTPG